MAVGVSSAMAALSSPLSPNSSRFLRLQTSSDQWQPHDLGGRVCVLFCNRATWRQGHFSLCSWPLTHSLYFRIIGSLPSSSLHWGLPAVLWLSCCHSCFLQKLPHPPHSSPLHPALPASDPQGGLVWARPLQKPVRCLSPVPNLLYRDQLFLQFPTGPPKWKCKMLQDAWTLGIEGALFRLQPY